jgi:hypothetical protein
MRLGMLVSWAGYMKKHPWLALMESYLIMWTFAPEHC